jgi:hypothetical protein
MRSQLLSKRRLVVALAVVGAIALIAVGAAYALTASSFKYSSPKTGYVRVSHMDFIVDGSGETYSVSWSDGLTATSGNCLNAGVDLPAGSLVKSITYYYKSGAASNFFGRFLRMQLATGTGLDLTAFATPTDDSGTVQAVTVNVPAANQGVTAGRSYGVGVCPGSDGTFYGARIRYTYTSAGS